MRSTGSRSSSGWAARKRSRGWPCSWPVTKVPSPPARHSSSMGDGRSCEPENLSRHQRADRSLGACLRSHSEREFEGNELSRLSEVRQWFLHPLPFIYGRGCLEKEGHKISNPLRNCMPLPHLPQR